MVKGEAVEAEARGRQGRAQGQEQGAEKREQEDGFFLFLSLGYWMWGRRVPLFVLTRNIGNSTKIQGMFEGNFVRCRGGEEGQALVP